MNQDDLTIKHKVVVRDPEHRHNRVTPQDYLAFTPIPRDLLVTFLFWQP